MNERTVSDLNASKPCNSSSDADSSIEGSLWYYSPDGVAIGPVPLATIRVLWNAGTLPSETYVVMQGEEDWQAISDVLGAGYTPPAPPPLPPTAIIPEAIAPSATLIPPPVIATLDSQTNQTVGEPLNCPPQQKQPTTKAVVQGCGCLAVIVLGLGLILQSCFSGFSGRGDVGTTKAVDTTKAKRAFPMTAEQFRVAFNNEQRQLKIEAFKEETIDGDPWVSCVFEDGSGLKINMERETGRICTIMCAFTKKPPKESLGTYLLAYTVIYVLSPEANSSETWKLIDRLTKEADGSDELKGTGELFRNLSVSMVSVSDSGLPLVMLLFTPRSTETIIEPAKPQPSPALRPGGRFSKLDSDGTIRHGFYRIKTAFPKVWNYVAWEYTLNPDGSIHFIDIETKKGVLVSQPFVVEEQYAAKGWEPK